MQEGCIHSCAGGIVWHGMVYTVYIILPTAPQYGLLQIMHIVSYVAFWHLVQLNRHSHIICTGTVYARMVHGMHKIRSKVGHALLSFLIATAVNCVRCALVYWRKAGRKKSCAQHFRSNSVHLRLQAAQEGPLSSGVNTYKILKITFRAWGGIRCQKQAERHSRYTDHIEKAHST